MILSEEQRDVLRAVAAGEADLVDRDVFATLWRLKLVEYGTADHDARLTPAAETIVGRWSDES